MEPKPSNYATKSSAYFSATLGAHPRTFCMGAGPGRRVSRGRGMGRGVVVWAIVDALRVTPDRGQHIFEVWYSRWCRARPMCPRIQLTGGAARFRARRGVRWLGSGSHANNRGKWAKKLNGSKTVDQNLL